MSSPDQIKLPPLRDTWLRIIGIPLLTLIITLVFTKGRDMLFRQFVQNFIIGFCYVFILWTVNRWIIVRMRLRYAGYQNTNRRQLMQWLFIALSTLVIFSIGHFLIMAYQYNGTPFQKGSLNGFLLDNLLGQIISFIIMAIYETLYSFSNWRQGILEAEDLKREKIEHDLDALKTQVNPHFLFNSLSLLTSLIEEDKERAVTFVHELSKVYRYMLQSNEMELTTLRKELESLNAYFSLLKTRFGDNLQEEISVPDEYLDRQLPPLTLQSLVENALQHNMLSSLKPLRIIISANGDNTIRVTNNLQKKSKMMSADHRIGLKEISAKYQLLHQPDIQVNETADKFQVTLPLIKNGAFNTVAQWP